MFFWCTRFGKFYTDGIIAELNKILFNLHFGMGTVVSLKSVLAQKLVAIKPRLKLQKLMNLNLWTSGLGREREIERDRE